jgi:hypothetical protein
MGNGVEAGKKELERCSTVIASPRKFAPVNPDNGLI